MASKPYEPTLKTLVEAAPEDWPVLAGLPRQPATVIEADVATVSGAADKVLRVAAEPPYLLHLEFVAGHDAADLPGLLHLRNALLGHRHGLRVRSVALLLRPEADSPQLTETLAQSFPGEEPYDVFRYRVIRAWRLPPQALLAGGIGTLPLVPISAVTEAELPGIIQRMEQRLGRRRPRAVTQAFWSATFILMGLRYSPALAAQLLQGVVSMKESATYQMILAEGKALGIPEGEKKMLLLLGMHRFGMPTSGTVAALEDINDLSQLEELGVRLLSAEKLARLAPRGRAAPPQRPALVTGRRLVGTRNNLNKLPRVRLPRRRKRHSRRRLRRRRGYV